MVGRGGGNTPPLPTSHPALIAPARFGGFWATMDTYRKRRYISEREYHYGNKEARDN